MYCNFLYRTYENSKFHSTMGWLERAMIFIGFVDTYGPMYDENYFSLISKLNAIIEYYLLTGDYKYIAELIIRINHSIVSDTPVEETFNLIKNYLEEVPVDSINGVRQKLVKRK